jgi:type II secretion system protein G
MPKNPGFTLIELLIVVAIIAILAAIAVPNFLEAQMRAKISRTKADMRSMATATEAYRVDNNQYPAWGPAYIEAGDISWDARQQRLTTPIAYVTSLPHDPFHMIHPHNPHALYDYIVTDYFAGDRHDPMWCIQDPTTPLVKFYVQVYIRSWGPDQLFEGPYDIGSGWHLSQAYDPTNGTSSHGDLWALMPGPVYYP